jgi:hydroxyacylglutathione hydrolase
MMQVDSLVVGEFQVNCFIVTGAALQAIVIDPGAEAGSILRSLRERRLTVAAYVLTHGHFDHVSALAEVCAAMPAPVVMHAADLAWVFEPVNQMLPFYPQPRRPAGAPRALQGGETLTHAELTYEVLHTPGHTPGSVCLHFAAAQVLFSGDTLFAGSVGRTDLPGGSARRLTQSLRGLAALPAATVVQSGHGPPTTIGAERQANFFMRGL